MRTKAGKAIVRQKGARGQQLASRTTQRLRMGHIRKTTYVSEGREEGGNASPPQEQGRGGQKVASRVCLLLAHGEYVPSNDGRQRTTNQATHELIPPDQTSRRRKQKLYRKTVGPKATSQTAPREGFTGHLVPCGKLAGRGEAATSGKLARVARRGL